MITAFTATQIAAGAYRLAFETDLPAADAPEFRVYRDGILIRTMAADADGHGEMTVAVQRGRFPVFEVLDDDTPTPSPGYPDYITLAWYAPSAGGVDHYRIEQSIDAVWTAKARVSETDVGYYTWASGKLADAQTHQFRVIPVGTNGNDGTAVTFTMLVVRTPDVPRPSYMYNSITGAVTLS